LQKSFWNLEQRSVMHNVRCHWLRIVNFLIYNYLVKLWLHFKVFSCYNFFSQVRHSQFRSRIYSEENGRHSEWSKLTTLMISFQNLKYFSKSLHM
jgi:hypothetical protein